MAVVSRRDPVRAEAYQRGRVVAAVLTGRVDEPDGAPTWRRAWLAVGFVVAALLTAATVVTQTW